MSIAVEFGGMDGADAAREEYAEYRCPMDDDKREKTVHFISDTPEAIIDKLRARGDEGTADANTSIPGVKTTDAERDRFDFTKPKVNVPWLRKIKGLAQHYGVSDWTSHVDPTLTVDEHRQVMRDAGQEGGGARMDPDQRDAERERRAAQVEQREGCNHARDECENGKPGACEFLKEGCGYDDDEVKQLLAATDGGGVDAEGDIGGKKGGALARSWNGYKGAVGEFGRALETAAEAWHNAQQAAQAINGIREGFDQEPIHFDALEAAQADLLDLVRKAAADCAECHADHSEHDHDVTSGDREDIREFVGRGASETPVGTSENTDRAVSDADLADRAPKRPDPQGDRDPNSTEALRRRRQLRGAQDLRALSEADDDRGGAERAKQNRQRPDAPTLTEEERGEAKKALRWGERNVRDLPRDRLRAIRGYVTDAANTPLQMQPRDWELLGDAIADYSIDGVGTPTPEALDSLLSKVQRAEDATPDPTTAPEPPREKGSTEQFSTERQGTLGVGVESEETAEEKQVTLTGDDEGANSAALPAAWKGGGDAYIAGPFRVTVEGTGGYGSDNYVVTLRNNEGERFDVATALRDRDRAADIAREFTDRISPEKVSFHSSDSAVQEAAAQAKQAASNTSGGLSDFN